MHHYFDDEDDFDFADTAAVDRLMRAQMREKKRLGPRRHVMPVEDDYDEFDDFEDYDDDEFDRYSGIGIDDL